MITQFTSSGTLANLSSLKALRVLRAFKMINIVPGNMGCQLY